MNKNNLPMNVLITIEKNAIEYISEKYPSTSPYIRNTIIENAKTFGLSDELVNKLKENGDIFQIIIYERNKLINYRGEFEGYKEQKLTMPERELIFWAIVNNIKTQGGYGDKLHQYMVSRYGNASYPDPFMPDNGIRELDRLLKEEEFSYEVFLGEQKRNYIEKEREIAIQRIKQNILDEDKLKAFGLDLLKF